MKIFTKRLKLRQVVTGESHMAEHPGKSLIGQTITFLNRKKTIHVGANEFRRLAPG